MPRTSLPYIKLVVVDEEMFSAEELHFVWEPEFAPIHTQPSQREAQWRWRGDVIGKWEQGANRRRGMCGRSQSALCRLSRRT